LPFYLQIKERIKERTNTKNAIGIGLLITTQQKAEIKGEKATKELKPHKIM